MSMNLLPDECLMHIFNSIAEVHTLFICLEVCRKWNDLVSKRLAGAERLLDKWVLRGRQLDHKSLRYSVRNKPLVEPILSKILKKSPRLKVVSIGYENERKGYTRKHPEWLQKSIDRLFKLESLEGLMITTCQPAVLEAIPPSLKSFYCEDSYINIGYYLQVKHLITEDDFFVLCIDRFPNIERLTFRALDDQYGWYGKAFQNQHVFKNLKMLEIDTASHLGTPCIDNLAVRFIDFCPQLESAHLKMAVDQKVPDVYCQHNNLTNLVISCVNFDQIESHRFNIMKMLKKFPNIKHLAIRSFTDYSESCYDFNSVDSEEERKISDDETESEDMDNVDSESDNLDDEESESDDKDSDESGYADSGDVESVESVESSNEDDEEKTRRLAIMKSLLLTIVYYLKKLELLDMRDLAGIDEASAELVRLHFIRNKRLNGKFYYGRVQDEEIKRDWPELFDRQRDSSAFNFMADHFLREFPKIELIQPNKVNHGHGNGGEVKNQ